MASETIADIVADLRELAADIEAGNAVVGQTVWRNYADRIEAAADCLREDEYHRGAEAREKFIYAVLGKPSNAAAMREALEKCRALAEMIWQSEGGEDVSAEIAELKDRISAALAAPPRNCDVGTEQEQEVRFEAFCHAHRSQERCCEDCPIVADRASCEFTWAQMPYKEGGAK